MLIKRLRELVWNATRKLMWEFKGVTCCVVIILVLVIGFWSIRSASSFICSCYCNPLVTTWQINKLVCAIWLFFVSLFKRGYFFLQLIICIVDFKIVQLCNFSKIAGIFSIRLLLKSFAMRRNVCLNWLHYWVLQPELCINHSNKEPKLFFPWMPSISMNA